MMLKATNLRHAEPHLFAWLVGGLRISDEIPKITIEQQPTSLYRCAKNEDFKNLFVERK